MRVSRADDAPNLELFSSPEVVAEYSRAEGLQPAEETLFRRVIRDGMAILDLGVGGGRTTPYLSAAAASYVGLDYSPAMIARCRSNYPRLRFEVHDARDLSAFPDASFDAAVFAFNGIDYLPSDSSRGRCLAEIARVLRDGGVFIFSSHNARGVIVPPVLRGARVSRVPWRIARAAAMSAALAARQLRAGAFGAGEGYVWDEAHGGLRTYTSTPKTLLPQLVAAGLVIDEVISGPDPGVRPAYLVPWYYYACRRLPRDKPKPTLRSARASHFRPQ